MGLELRPALNGDVDQIADLLAARGDSSDAVDLRLMVDDIGLDGVAVVVDGTRVVSTASLLDETLRVRHSGGQLELAAGQVELVATDTEYEGRGLVRALMAWAHEQSAARGHDLQVMIGIPYFYRLFGYEYAIDISPARGLRELAAADPAMLARPATADDMAAIDQLQHGAQAAADVTMPRSAAEWGWVVGGDSSTTWVAERAGSVVATCRASGEGDDVVVTELATVDRASGEALLHGVGAQTVAARPSIAAMLDDVLAPYGGTAEQYYVRLPDVGAVLDLFRPAFTSRLRASGVDRSGRDLVISTFGAHHRMAITDDGVGPVSVGGPMQAPGAAGGCGVAPDALAALLTGPFGMHGLSRRRPDVYPGGDAELYETLFPPQTADLLTWYLPY